MQRCALITTIALSLFGCSGGDQPGQVQFALVGADHIQLFDLTTATPENTTPSEVVSAIVIVDEIDARVGGKWTPLVTAQQSIDLLKLDNKTLNTLGVANLPSGHIDELRLKLDEIGDYVVLKSGAKKPLEVPVDGIVKVTGKLDLDSCAAGIVILDFDPKIKTEDEPGRREYELLCSAHVKTEEVKNACGGGVGGGSDGGGAGGNDMAGNPCNGVICPSGQSCSVQGGVAVCGDPCNGIVCPSGQVCSVVGGVGVCGAPADGGMSGGNADGGCMHH